MHAFFSLLWSYIMTCAHVDLSFVGLQDAYMPKDATKQSHRGIGFVTFASADSVEAVMSAPHTMNGQELAIDRATPKDKVCQVFYAFLCPTGHIILLVLALARVNATHVNRQFG